MKYCLVPQPASIVDMPGKFLLTQDCINKIADYSLECSLPEFINYHCTSDTASEGYSLVINDNMIKISSSDDAGKFYAVKTLLQLSRQLDSDGLLSNLSIEDKPVFKNRAVMLDISRNKVPKMETLYRLIDFWSELKFNQVQLYMENTFAYKNHETVWRDASPMTAEEIRRLDKYCRYRAIELVPNQASFGHMERWLKHDEYKYLAESPDGFVDSSGIRFDYSSTLDPGSDETMAFIRGLYDELLPCFSSSTLNVGGDETYDLGQGKSKKRCEEIGVGRVYLEFLKKLEKEVSGRGKKMQFWGDIILNHPELIGELPKNLVAMNWGYEAGHPFAKETAAFAKAGLEYYVCAGTASWNTTAGKWNNVLENIRNAAENGEKNGASGFMITDWGDNGHWQQYTVSVPGYMAGASAAWSGMAGTIIDFEKALRLHYFMDSTTGAAKALLKMANLYEKYSKGMHNSSIFAIVMMEPSYSGYRFHYHLLKGIDFREALTALPEIRELIKNAVLGAEDDNLIKDELSFTADMLEFGIKLTAEVFDTADLKIQDIPEEKRQWLANTLEALIPEFERLWLTRNRPGGLAASKGLLVKLGTDYLKK